MSSKTSYGICLIIIIALLGAGCQGASPVRLGGGGVGGTGISSGAISAFGSIFVNGVEFDIADALANKQVLVDGRPVTAQNDLALGMVVSVTGTFNSDHKTGTATRVEYYDDLLGPVQSVDPAAGTIKILNLTVSADIKTVFTGDAGFNINSANNLAVLKNLLNQGGPLYVEVSGLWGDANVLYATSVAVKSAYSGDSEVRGTIEQLDSAAPGTFKLRGLTVDYHGADLRLPLTDGASVEVYGSIGGATNAFTASRIVPDEAAIATKVNSLEGQELGVQGLVSRLDTSAKTFFVEGVPVNYGGAKIESETGNTFTLQNGARIEVKGRIQGGILTATHMEGDEGDFSNGTANVLVNIDTLPVQSTDVAGHRLTLSPDPNDPNAIMTVQVTPNTLFEDERNLGLPLNYDSAFGSTPAAIQQGNRVEVGGYRDTATGVISAARIEVKY